jgi:hypothetical protein
MLERHETPDSDTGRHKQGTDKHMHGLERVALVRSIQVGLTLLFLFHSSRLVSSRFISFHAAMSDGWLRNTPSGATFCLLYLTALEAHAMG